MGRREHLGFLDRCVELAWESSRDHSRRPFVGALITNQEGEVLGEGHKYILEGTKYQIHAERDAIARARLHPLWEETRAKGSLTLYSTLEPCIPIKDSRRKQRRPQILNCCAQLIVDSGISTVVVAALDNSMGMSPGQGLNYLEKRGVKVQEVYSSNLRTKIKGLMGLYYELPSRFEIISAQEDFEEEIRRLQRAIN